MFELDHSYLESVVEAIRRDFGFEPVVDHFAIFGQCETHEAAARPKRRLERRELSEQNIDCV